MASINNIKIEIDTALVEENKKLREALISIASSAVICGSTGDFRDGQLVALERCRKVASYALPI